MRCPACGCDCPEDAARCPGCGASFASDTVSGEPRARSGLVPLLSTTDIGYLAVVKSLLESAGIRFAVQGEEGLHLFPITMSGSLFRSQALAATVLVCREDEEDARRLIEEGRGNGWPPEPNPEE